MGRDGPHLGTWMGPKRCKNKAHGEWTGAQDGTQARVWMAPPETVTDVEAFPGTYHTSWPQAWGPEILSGAPRPSAPQTQWWPCNWDCDFRGRTTRDFLCWKRVPKRGEYSAIFGCDRKRLAILMVFSDGILTKMFFVFCDKTLPWGRICNEESLEIAIPRSSRDMRQCECPRQRWTTASSDPHKDLGDDLSVLVKNPVCWVLFCPPSGGQEIRAFRPAWRA